MARRNEGFLKKTGVYLAFAGPSTFAFFSVTLISFLYGLYLTFTDWNPLSNTGSFVGFQNYIATFSDAPFWTSFFLTIKFVFFSVVFTNVLGFILAYFLTKGIKASNLFKTSFFASNLIGGIIMGLIWRFIFNEGLVALGTLFKIPLFETAWLSTPEQAFWALVIVFVWQMSGYMMVIYIAGLMSIPRDVLEAASIDGAEGFKRLRMIVLPMVMPSFTICLFLTLQRAFITYDVNLALTQGGPFGSTELVAMRIYNKAFISQQYGIGQSQALLLFLMVAVITLIQVYFSKKAELEA